jgi:hypothetical protein
MIQAWTGERHGAKQRVEGACVVLFDPERLPTMVTLGMGRHIGEGGFVAIVIAHHELDSDLHGSRPPVWVTPARWLILLQTEGLPPGF